MDKIERTQLYNTAWKHWGAEMQADVLIGELAELIHALIMARRNGTFYTYSVSEEMADVLICLEQFEIRMLAFPHGDIRENGELVGFKSNLFEGQVLKIKDAKLLRLKERLIASMKEKHEDISGLENPR
jgi:hypothetical protein